MARWPGRSAGRLLRIEAEVVAIKGTVFRHGAFFVSVGFVSVGFELGLCV